MSKSIMEAPGTQECWNCGDTRNLEVHHVFYGTRARKKSEHYGLKVHLCPGCHRWMKTGIHGGNHELDIRLKQEAERLFESKYSRELFRQEGIEVSYKGPDEDVPPIVADSERMKQVFCNVLDNAAKHGGAGKRIDVSAACEDGKFVIRVRDYGPGIPEEELPFVKQKFYKGSSKARGSGIGLAVCDEIVRLHGGTFDIANAEGGGAVVTISLPMS